MTNRQTPTLNVIVVGQSPPPYGGQAIMIGRFVKSKLAGVNLVHVRMGFSSNMDEVGRVRFSKITHMLGLIARIIYHRFANRARILYYPPAGPDRVPMFRDFIVLIATRWLFQRTIFHYHSGGISELYDELPRWQQWFFRRAYFGADAAIRLAEMNPEDGKKLEAKREFVIPNGIDDPFPDFVALQTLPTISPQRKLRILFVGILRESKGVSVLIEACGKLVPRGVPFEVELMGQWNSSEFADSVRRRIQELNLNEHIRFLGLLTGDEKFAAYCRADVLCFPTFFNNETFGVVLVEAMACGLPTVSTRWRAIPAVVDDGETGFLVEPHDADAVADKLAILASDVGLRSRMGQAGRSKFLREFTFTRHEALMRRALLETAGVKTPKQANAIPEPATASSVY
jgi:glycosyltransferase involved in cell wall biosynthesis